jgi:hypothetical protein
MDSVSAPTIPIIDEDPHMRLDLRGSVCGHGEAPVRADATGTAGSI